MPALLGGCVNRHAFSITSGSPAPNRPGLTDITTEQGFTGHSVIFTYTMAALACRRHG